MSLFQAECQICVTVLNGWALGVQMLERKRGYCLRWVAKIRNRCAGVQQGAVGGEKDARRGEGEKGLLKGGREKRERKERG